MVSLEEREKAWRAYLRAEDKAYEELIAPVISQVSPMSKEVLMAENKYRERMIKVLAEYNNRIRDNK